MSKSIFKKAVIAATSITAVLAMSATAFAQTTLEMSERDDKDQEKSCVNVVADQVYAAAGEEVAYSVFITNSNANGGYYAAGFQLFYDEALTPRVKVAGTDKIDLKKGPAVEDMQTVSSLSLPMHVLAFSSSSQEGNFNDGAMYTVFFTVPEDAKVGTKYDFTIVMDNWRDLKSEPIENNVMNGWIVVTGDESSTTTETTTSSGETTTTTSETTTATTSETTSETTSATTSETTSETTTETTTNGKKPGSDESTTTTTTTTSKTSTTTTTTKGGNGGSTTSASAVKTGDAGVGVAAAALALAAVAGTAVAVIKKKED